MRAIIILLIGICAGCGARQEIVVQRVSVTHNGWDTLAVSAEFVRKTTLGQPQPLVLDERRIIAYNASYDTLYAGSDTVFAVPDAELGNEERILIELCGFVKQLVVCEQSPISASPKRIRLEPDIDYPLRSAVYQGEYRLPFTFERLRYGEKDTWEPLERSSSPNGYINAYVEGRKAEAIRVPFTRNRGGFNLAQDRNYKDFKYYLDSALLDFNEASVRFDIYVDVNGFAGPVGSIAKAVSVKTEDEHQEEVARFAEQATEQIVDRLNPFLGRRKNVVYIDGWDYNSFKQMYSVKLEITWSGSLFARSDYQLAGMLEIYEGGQRALFRKTQANRRASNRWDSEVEGNVLTLRPLLQTAQTEGGAQGPFQENNGLVVIEAEHYTGVRSYRGQSWVQNYDRSDTRGDGSVAVLPDRGVRIRTGYDEDSPELTYPVSFDRAGDYYIWLRVWAEDDNSNSVHMGLNGTAFRSSSAIEITQYRRWVWTRSLSGSRENASIRVFSPGVRTLNLWMREDGLYVDRILLTTDRYFMPEGSGPEESQRYPDGTSNSSFDVSDGR